jgi:hypothetical protein
MKNKKINQAVFDPRLVVIIGNRFSEEIVADASGRGT